MCFPSNTQNRFSKGAADAGSAADITDSGWSEFFLRSFCVFFFLNRKMPYTKVHILMRTWSNAHAFLLPRSLMSSIPPSPGNDTQTPPPLSWCVRGRHRHSTRMFPRSSWVCEKENLFTFLFNFGKLFFSRVGILLIVGDMCLGVYVFHQHKYLSDHGACRCCA